MRLGSTHPLGMMKLRYLGTPVTDWTDAWVAQRLAGGLLVYTKNTHDYQHITEWNVGTPDIEAMWVKLSLNLTHP